MRGILNHKITWLDMTVLMSRLRELFLLIHSHHNRVMITTLDTRYHMLAKLYLPALELYINCALIFRFLFLLCFDFSILHVDVAGQVLTMGMHIAKLYLLVYAYAGGWIFKETDKHGHCHQLEYLPSCTKQAFLRIIYPETGCVTARNESGEFNCHKYTRL